MTKSDWDAALLQVEQHYDLGSGFLHDLLHEGDWSFVIKAHALLEAAASQLLTHYIGDHRLAGLVERLELSRRLSFLQALDLIDKSHHRFVCALSEFRNRLAHNVHSVRFHFSDHLAALDPNQLASFWEWSTFFVTPSDRQSVQHPANAKPMIWFGTVLVVVDCLNRTNESKYRHSRIERALDILSAWEDEDETEDEP